MTIDDGRAGGPHTGGGLGAGAKGRVRHSAHELERYETLFASRTSGMRSSAMRDLMAITERPDVISLAGGLPDTSTFPAELLAKLLSQVAAESAARALQYGPTEGMAAAVECITQVMAEEGTMVDGEDVIVTTGGQQVIDLVCKTLIDPGDVIVAEAPTYPGAVPAFGAYQADVVQIEMDGDGMPIDVLEQQLDRLEAEGRRPKFIYTIPNFQNPAGVTMSLARRHRLVEVARERELLILEDNPYGLLRYEGEPLPTLYSLDASSAGRGGASDFVIYLGTFSKILSPGIRLGWAVAPRPVLEKLNLGKQGVDLCSSSMSQLFVAAYFAAGQGSSVAREGAAPRADPTNWRGYIESLRALYRHRRDAMLDALAQHLPAEARWTHPQGGLFIWVTLPDYIDTTDLLARALETESVAFVPGRAAYTDGRGASSMRLNFSGVSEQEIHDGVRRIGKVINEQVAMYGTLTGTQRAPAKPDRAPPAPAPPAGGKLADVVTLPRRTEPARQSSRPEAPGPSAPPRRNER
jgi:2-aminoadipate transaminase